MGDRADSARGEDGGRTAHERLVRLFDVAARPGPFLPVQPLLPVEPFLPAESLLPGEPNAPSTPVRSIAPGPPDRSFRPEPVRGLMPSLPGAAPSTTEPTLRSTWGVPPRAALAVVALCLVVVIGLVARSVWAGHGPPAAVVVPAGSPTRPPMPATSPTAPGSNPEGSTAGTDGAVPSFTAGSGQAPETRVLVHVVGSVKRPGVVALAAGARVLDAVDAVGGPSRGADLSLLNLARAVIDGEQIRVPARGETAAPAPAPAPAPGDGGGGASSGGAGGPVNLNSADESALDTLPGVGPVLAGRIVQWRTENGRFTSVDELAEIAGIGERVLEGLRDLVTV